ncbi:uncharacterized protein LOC134257017 [Saccostrea cucullata]|uniref:uncharacterized protein LOC134257017 n=1 Tax=Saccostrea cuccullata TaxID=36930 RepID=UPI002ED32165
MYRIIREAMLDLESHLIFFLTKPQRWTPWTELKFSSSVTCVKELHYRVIVNFVRLTCVRPVYSSISRDRQKHRVVPYKERTSTPNNPKCHMHSKNCELYCEQCDIPVCSNCLSTGKHKEHPLSDVLQKLNFKTKDLENELKELETRIYPKYEEIASDIRSKKDNLETHYSKLTTAVTTQGEDRHREINIIVNKQKSEIDEMKTQHLAALNKQENEIKQIAAKVNQYILDLKEILDCNEASLTFAYKSRNAEFRYLPPDLNVSLPDFSPRQINTEELRKLLGFLSPLSITIEDCVYTFKPLLDEPELIATIDTGYANLNSVACLSDENIWTCGDDKIIKLYNFKGKLLKSIKTKSRRWPVDLTVTRCGDLVYTDSETRTVNIVKKKQIQEVIKLQGWKPYFVSSTSSGDLLVIMDSEDKKQSKVVRYSGSAEKQTIQFDSEGKPLYLTGDTKHISESRNLDICVADWGARAVVVVNQAGKLRFRYTGHPSTNKGSFDPYSITTDSQSQILTADIGNDCIHILDQDGQFLRYIDNCDLHDPSDLCTDSRDNLFVAEWKSGKVKKIKYM